MNQGGYEGAGVTKVTLGVAEEDVDSGSHRRTLVGVVLLGVVAGIVIVGNVGLVLQNRGLSLELRAVWTMAPLLALASTLYVTHWTASQCRTEYLLYVGGWIAVWAAVAGVAGGASAYFEFLAGEASPPTLRPFLTWAAGGVIIGSLVGRYDASRRMREHETERARRQAEALAETLSVLNRVLRHDIRNDVNVIEGYLELLVDDGDVDPAYLEPVERRVDDIIELADHARQAEQLVREEMPETTEIDVVERLEDAIADVEADHDGAVKTDFPESATVCGHELIDSAFTNLVENALEHNTSSNPWAEVSVRRRGDTVVVEVADNGPGIPESEVRVLETGGESALEHSSGTGLWLVHWIVQRSGGDVSFHRNEPRGSRVRIEFPAANPR